MFSTMYIHILAIMLFIFVSMNRGESTKLEDIEKLHWDSLERLPRFAQAVLIKEGGIERQKDKIINATAKTGNNINNVEMYISCWRKIYEDQYGLELFMNGVYKLQHEPEQFGPYTEEHSLQQCVQNKANTYAAKLPSVQAANCDKYRIPGHEQDFYELQNKIKYSYYQRMWYGEAILFNKIHETAIVKLRLVRGRN
uniref:Uncharacterized protein n=1 Tax=Trichobilharzia regenti TaxID=157069 RepID=A0AA85K3R4_TRIRE|nr:unnamed protein product [Trichobilharzia regenti]